MILIPADPEYSPAEHELWPLVNDTIHQTLAAHPEILAGVGAAVRNVLAAHRGWRNPYPAQFKSSFKPI